MRRVRPMAARGETGAVAPATAAVLAVLIAFVGLVGDTSVWFAERRALQAATDAAALAAAPWAASATEARRQGEAILIANGVPATAIASFQTGWYCPDAPTADARFQTAPCAAFPGLPANAVRIGTQTRAPAILSRLVAPETSRRIALRAVAAQVDQAGLEAGAGVASLNAGLTNAVLSALTGGTVDLTLADYNGLAAMRIESLALLDALATEAGVTAGTYRDLLDTEVAVTHLLDAAVEVLSEHDQAAGAAAAVAGLRRLEAQVPSARRIRLGQLFDLGMWEAAAIGHSGASTTALDAGVNLFQLTSFALQLSNGGHAASIPGAALGVPGLASAGLEATVIEPPQRAYFAFGPEGVSVHTAAVRMKLNLSVPALAGILLGAQAPLYLEVASGDARITAIECQGRPSIDARVRVAARSGLANLYLGSPSLDVMRNTQRPVTYADIEPMRVLDLNLLGLGLVELQTGARGHVTIGASGASPTQLTFVQPAAATGALSPVFGVIGRPLGGRSDPLSPVPARVSAASLASGLGGLAETLEVNIRSCLLFVCTNQTLQGPALGTLFNVLDPVLTGLDAPVTGLLQALGVQAGYMDVAVTGVRCGLPVLIA